MKIVAKDNEMKMHVRLLKFYNCCFYWITPNKTLLEWFYNHYYNKTTK